MFRSTTRKQSRKASASVRACARRSPDQRGRDAILRIIAEAIEPEKR
jgi:hypothetical protein